MNSLLLPDGLPLYFSWVMEMVLSSPLAAHLPVNGPVAMRPSMVPSLKKATYYKGDSNYLKLAPEDKKSYVQLGHYSK